MSQNLPKRSLWYFLYLRHPNHFVLAGANSRNVIITYTDSSRSLFKQIEIFSRILTVYFNRKYFPYYTRELLVRVVETIKARQNN